MSVRSSTNCSAGTLTARSVARVPTISTSPRTQTGLPHARRILPGAVSTADEAEEALLPLIAPDLEVDVDDVVVGDRDLAERVRDGERARLVARVEVPDDPHDVAAPLDAEGPGRAGLEARLVPAPVTRRRARPRPG